MLYSEIIAVCSEIHTKHINTLCGQNVEFVNVKPGGTYSNHWVSVTVNSADNPSAALCVYFCIPADYATHVRFSLLSQFSNQGQARCAIVPPDKLS